MAPVIPGLTPAEAATYAAAMMAPGAVTRRRATVLDLDHQPLQSLTGILGGQVRWNAKADVRTEASVTFSDFDDEIDLDPRHLVRVEMGVDVDDADDRETLWAPVITGWVQGCDDTGYETEVVLHGKEKFGLRATKRGRAKRGERVGEVIWRMHHQIGERHIVIPDHLRDSGPKLADSVEWGGGKPEKSVTRMARRLAKRAGLQVYYDQLGRLDLRRTPEQARLSFSETASDRDVEVRLLGPIQWSSDYTQLCNRVIGAGKRDLRSVATVRGGYRFAPGGQGLSRGGEPVELIHRFTDDTLDSRAELSGVTEAMVTRLSKARSQVRITSTPATWLLVEDLLRAEKRSGRQADFWMETGSLELDGSSMAIGYQQTTARANRVRVRTTGRAKGNKKGGGGR